MKQLFSPVFSILNGFIRIARIIAKDKPLALLGRCVILPITSLIPFAIAGVTGLLVNSLITIQGTGQLTQSVILLILALIVVQMGTAVGAAEEYLSYLLRYYLQEKFAVLGMKKRGSLDTLLLEDPKQNDLFLRYEEKGIDRVVAFFEVFPYYMGSIIQVAVALFIFSINLWWSIPLAIIASIPRTLVESKYGRNIFDFHDARSETRRKAAEIKSHFQTAPKIAEMKLFQTLHYWYTAFEDTFKGFQKEQEYAERIRFFAATGATIFSYAVNGVVLFILIYKVAQGQLSIGTFTFLSASLVQLQASLSSFFRWSGRLHVNSLFLSDVLNFLDIKNTMPHAKNGIVLKNEAPSIEFQNVSFKYSDSEKNVITDFSLLIPAGSKVALVGLNGAGKTTLVKLLCRFYDPTAGSILIDGHDLREVDIESWYSILGVLFQDYDHYRLQTKDAIAIGRSDIPQDFAHIRAAAHEGEANTFIEKWEKKYDQPLGHEFENGVEPSIGQWQKLALARTFYRDPRMLILDEPTASIDAEAEANIFDQIRSTEKARTLMLISHRFSTVRHTDQIVVMEHGKILEKGTHNELMKEEGKYSELFKLQAEGYKE